MAALGCVCDRFLLLALLLACVPQVVSHLDILAQTIALLEQRLTLTEEKGLAAESVLKQVLENQQKMLAHMEVTGRAQ